MEEARRDARSPNYWFLVWRQFRKDRLAMAGFFLVLFLIAVALLAGLLANNKPIVLKYRGKWYLPAVRETFFLPEHPDLRSLNFQRLSTLLEAGDFTLYAPVRYSPTDYDLEVILSPPGREHPFGTDDRGRDVLSRMITVLASPSRSASWRWGSTSSSARCSASAAPSANSRTS